MPATIVGSETVTPTDDSIPNPVDTGDLSQLDQNQLMYRLRSRAHGIWSAKEAHDSDAQHGAEAEYAALRSEVLNRSHGLSWKDRRALKQQINHTDNYAEIRNGTGDASRSRRFLGAAALIGTGAMLVHKWHDSHDRDRVADTGRSADRLRIMGDDEEDEIAAAPVTTDVTADGSTVTRPGRFRRGWDRVYYGPAVATTYGATRMAGGGEDGSGNRAARIITGVALLALTGYLVYRIGNGLVRIGESTIFDFGDGKDLGIDLLGWPLDHGDRGQGDGSGLDLNFPNKTNAFNDDPVKHITSRGGFDIIPPYFDGDGGSLPHMKGNHSVGEDIANLFRGRTDGDKTARPAVQAAAGGIMSPGPLLDAGHVPAATPQIHDTAQHNVWHPRDIDVKQGEGLIQKFRELGQSVVGPKHHYTDGMAQNLLRDSRHEWGDNLITTPGHHGSAVYTDHGDLRIAAPGHHALASQRIEREIIDDILDQEKAAEKAAKLKAA
jgi:hypothetical protein